MIKITYDELGKINLQQAVQKLANCPMRTPQAFAIKHITKALREGFFKMRDEYMKDVRDVFAVKGKEEAPEAGGKSAEMQLPFECQAGKEQEAKQALDAFGKRLLTISKNKISPETLFQCGEWSARELETLEFMVEEPVDA